MPVCRVVIATNFPEGNWQSNGNELVLAQSLHESLLREGIFQEASHPSVEVRSHFRELLEDLVTSCDDQYFLFLTALHMVIPSDIIKAVRRISASGGMVTQCPSQLVRDSKGAEAITDLLYQGTPPLVKGKLPSTSPVRLPGLIIRRDALAEFIKYIKNPKKLHKLLDSFPGSDGLAIALRLFLSERGVDVSIVDAPLFRMRPRYIDAVAIPTIHRRLILAAAYNRLGALFLGRKHPLKVPRLPLRKSIRRDSITRVCSKFLGLSAAVPFEDLENLSLSQRESLHLLRKAGKSVSTRLGVLSWQIAV